MLPSIGVFRKSFVTFFFFFLFSGLVFFFSSICLGSSLWCGERPFLSYKLSSVSHLDSFLKLSEKEEEEEEEEEASCCLFVCCLKDLGRLRFL